MTLADASFDSPLHLCSYLTLLCLSYSAESRGHNTICPFFNETFFSFHQSICVLIYLVNGILLIYYYVFLSLVDIQNKPNCATFVVVYD